MLLLLAALVLTAEPVVCRVDADCAIVVRCGCGCCANGPSAVTKDEAQEITNHCNRIGPCMRPEGCAAIVCEPPASPDGMRAICKSNQCVMVPRGKPARR